MTSRLSACPYAHRRLRCLKTANAISGLLTTFTLKFCISLKQYFSFQFAMQQFSFVKTQHKFTKPLSLTTTAQHRNNLVSLMVSSYNLDCKAGRKRSFFQVEPKAIKSHTPTNLLSTLQSTPGLCDLLLGKTRVITQKIWRARLFKKQAINSMHLIPHRLMKNLIFFIRDIQNQFFMHLQKNIQLREFNKISNV